MRAMQPMLRHLPDFYTESGFLVEVMGLGKDGVLKLKLDKYDSLREWNKVQPVMLFAWNSYKKTYAMLDAHALKTAVARARKRGIRAFPSDGVEYYPIEWADVLELADVVEDLDVGK